ncbi:hypothetical protein HanPI659440_Chr12g0456381 [Helianthus annuus]|nr:hypothetical protein HanPI659440_Chr12g0456381 [Helianthus annuus]
MIFLNQWKYQLIHPSHLHPSAFCFGFRRAAFCKLILFKQMVEFVM